MFGGHSPKLDLAFEYLSENCRGNQNLSDFSSSNGELEGLEKFLDEGHIIEIRVDKKGEYIIIEAQRQWDSSQIAVSFANTFEIAYESLKEKVKDEGFLKKMLMTSNEIEFTTSGQTIIPCTIYVSPVLFQ